MELILLSYLPGIVGLYLIGLATYRNNPQRPTNRLFALFSAVVASWLVFLLLADTANSVNQGLWFLRAALAAGTPLGLVFLLFCDQFPQPSERPLSMTGKRWLLAITVLFAALSLTPLLVNDVTLGDGGLDINEVTLLYSLQSLFIIGQILYGLVLIYRKRQQASVAQRAQIKVFSRGIIVALLFNILSGLVFVFFSVGGEIATLASGVSLLIMATYTWVAVAQHGMFNLRRSVIRAVSYVLSIALVVSVYALVVEVIVERYVTSEALRIGLIAVSALIIIVVFGPFRRWFDRATDRVFRQHSYDSREELARLNDGLVSRIITVPSITEHTIHVLRTALRPSYITILIRQEHEVERYGKNLSKPEVFITHIQRSHKTTVVDMLPDDQATPFVKNKVSLIVPLHTSSSHEGFIVFGQRTSGEHYSASDISFIELAAQNIALAVTSAKSYQKITAFNQTLKQEIRKATQELQVKNDELEALHKTKDDFISMASHQLRPKITAAKGFLDLLDQSSLQTTTDQSELLDLTGKSIDHMSGIVTDMLDISRMEADGVASALALTLTKMSDLISEEVELLSADDRDGRFKLTISPAANKTKLSIDPVKLREVVQNLLTNAQQYSPEDSTIIVAAKISKGRFVFSVTDTGFGMSKAEQARLFEKFYRSDEAKRLRPNGSGVGLYVSKQIVEAHGGKMSVKSAPKKGSTIGFSLPLG